MLKRQSLFHNFIFNLIKTLNSILFPIITFAYSSRILGVAGVGKVNFAKSFVSYFIMLAMLGMNYYGTREAAKLRNEKDALSKFCIEMLIINSCTTLLSYALLVVTIIFVPLLREYDILLLICSAAIILQGMGMEWLYQAMEEYRYIAVRSTIFQIGALLAMFVLVRDKNDVVAYAIITVAASSGSYILNFFNARNYIYLHRHMHIEIVKHLKPLLWLFAMAVSIELYTVLDTTMLGFLKGDTAVGLYTAAIKVERLVNTLIASIGVVLIPRLSFYIGQGEFEKTFTLIDRGYNYVFMLSIPAAIGLFLLSDDIILLFSGNAFVSAGMTMRLMVLIVIFIPFSMMTNQQTFVPMGRENLILISTFVGAATNLILNSLLIPRFAENGAAMATVIAEAAVAVVCLLNVRKFFDMRAVFKSVWQYWIAAIPFPFIFMVCGYLPIGRWIKMSIMIVLSMTFYFFILLIFKNSYFLEVKDMIKGKLHLNNHCGRDKENL